MEMLSGVETHVGEYNVLRERKENIEREIQRLELEKAAAA